MEFVKRPLTLTLALLAMTILIATVVVAAQPSSSQAEVGQAKAEKTSTEKPNAEKVKAQKMCNSDSPWMQEAAARTAVEPRTGPHVMHDCGGRCCAGRQAPGCHGCIRTCSRCHWDWC